MAEDKFVARMGQCGGGKIYALELRLNKEIAENARLRDCIGQLEEALQEYHEAMQESVQHGKWIEVVVAETDTSRLIHWLCSECEIVVDHNTDNYCPNCGAKMECD